MQAYAPMQTMGNYQPMYAPPYQDRLAQLQSQYQQSFPQPQIQQPQPLNQGLLWVQGEAGAKSYLVAPNTTVLLMDSESQKFYLKSTDNAGMPSLRVFEYAEISQNAPQAPNISEKDLDVKYVTRDEYEGLKRQYGEIIEKLNSLSEKEIAKQSRTKVKGVSVDEQSDI